MLKRSFDPLIPERMDVPQEVSEELIRDLQNLVSLNRRFGSHRLLLKFARRWLRPGGDYKVLDLATGAGDLPRELVLWARRHGVRLSIDAVDFQGATLSIARDHSLEFPEIRWVEGDVRTFEPGRRYDLVLCSLALHHFSEDDAVRVLQRCAALSLRWVLVSDLERSLLTTFGVWLLTQFFYRDPMTRFDARISAERAFSMSEFTNMCRLAGWRDLDRGRFLFSRQAVWMEREWS